MTKTKKVSGIPMPKLITILPTKWRSTTETVNQTIMSLPHAVSREIYAAYGPLRLLTPVYLPGVKTI
jgi:hypothetical protein